MQKGVGGAGEGCFGELKLKHQGVECSISKLLGSLFLNSVAVWLHVLWVYLGLVVKQVLRVAIVVQGANCYAGRRGKLSVGTASCLKTNLKILIISKMAIFVFANILYICFAELI